MSINAEICLESAAKVNEEGELLNGLWYVGVALSIFSSVASNLGVNVQKYSLTKEIKRVKTLKATGNKRDVHEKPYIRQPIWLSGLILIILGAIGDFAALGFAAQTLAAPVGGFTLVANIFFGHYFLGEYVGKRDLFATGMILSGVILVAVSGEKTDKTFSLDCLLELYKRNIFLVYIGVVILTCFLLLFLALRLAKMRQAEPQPRFYKRIERIHPIIPTALSGILGSQSVLFAKSTAEILKVTFTEENQLRDWQLYLIIFCMLFSIFSQLHWLAHSLRLFDAVLVVPLFQCFFISGGVVGGGIFFNEFASLSKLDITIFSVGLACILIGVYILSFRKISQEDDVVEGRTTTATAIATAELKHRLEQRLSRDVRGGSFLGIDLIYQPASKRKLSQDLLGESTVQERTLQEPASMPAMMQTRSRTISVDSAASAPTPLSVMPQFAITDVFTGIKQGIKRKASSKRSPNKIKSQTESTGNTGQG